MKQIDNLLCILGHFLLKVKNSPIQFSGDFLHKLLSSFLLSKAELMEHGFPLPHESEHGRAVLHVKDDRRKKMPKESQRECSRCGIIYSVDNKGMPEKLALDDLCIFHPKRTFKKRRGAHLSLSHHILSIIHECMLVKWVSGCCIEKVGCVAVLK